MRIENQKTVKDDVLAKLIPFDAGATFSQLWQIFYFTRLFKYVHRKHYPMIKPAFNKICTDKNLKKLCELGYFKSPQKDIYCATDKVLPFLRETGKYPVDILPKESEGKGSINELNNTNAFVQLYRKEKFSTLLYFDFDYLRPDALMVEKDKVNRKYKLTFLEIEAQKPDWVNYITQKKDKYLRLAKDIRFYNYWCEICPHLEFPKPNINELSFSVLLVGKIKIDFGKGFSFIEIIPE